MRFRVQILHVRPDNHEILSQYNPERTYGKYQPISLRASCEGPLRLIEKSKVGVFPTMKWTWRNLVSKEALKFFNYHHSKNISVNLTQLHEILFSRCAFLVFISSSFSRKKHTLSINGISISIRRLPHKLLIFCVA